MSAHEMLGVTCFSLLVFLLLFKWALRVADRRIARESKERADWFAAQPVPECGNKRAHHFELSCRRYCSACALIEKGRREAVEREKIADLVVAKLKGPSA